MSLAHAGAAALGLGAIVSAGIGAVAITGRVSTEPAVSAPQAPSIPWGPVLAMVLLVAFFFVWLGAD